MSQNYQTWNDELTFDQILVQKNFILAAGRLYMTVPCGAFQVVDLQAT